MATFSETDLLAISEVFGHSQDGLTESELNSAFEICGFPFESSSTSRTQTIYQALKEQQATGGDRKSVLAFLRVSMSPDRFEENPDRFSRLRAQLNEQLMLCGFQIEEDGSLSKTEDLDDEQIGLLRYMFRVIGLGRLVD
ncbi:MAG: hypothetical protein IH878_12685 [Gemmatimonadetes bacterium]|nr:hypothetical protein [Gemmatimonadota bacterium]